ncbi:MAG: hypothetical protein KC435_12070 [Thermomicrobiales bacterium]|jgi:hypothetical protein|nr:hypothetical protein [Thermomicrobiales bacterium]
MAGDEDKPDGQHYSFTSEQVFQFTEAWWKERGLVAQQSGEELNHIAARASGLFTVNHFGDCVEGRHMHAMFRRNIDEWVASLELRSASAKNLADACFGAANTLATTDHDSAGVIMEA